MTLDLNLFASWVLGLGLAKLVVERLSLVSSKGGVAHEPFVVKLHIASCGRGDSILKVGERGEVVITVKDDGEGRRVAGLEQDVGQVGGDVD